MAEETDGLEEAFEGQLRVLVAAAGRIGENVARARADAARQAKAGSEQEARELASRLVAEQRAARAELAGVHQGQWWERATPAQIAHAYQVARAWSAEEPEARRTEQRIREELRTRYGVTVENTNPDPAALRTAVEQAQQDRAHAVDERSRGALEVVEAQQLLQEAERLDATDEAGSSGAGSREDGRTLYDSAERRQAAADDLEAKGIEREVAATLMRADVSQAKPATHALKADDADTGTKARRTHGRVAQAHRSGLDR